MGKSKLIIVLNALLKGTKDALTTTALGKGVGTFVTEIASNYDKLTKSQKKTLTEAKQEEIKNALKGTDDFPILVRKVENIENHLLNLLKDKLERIDTKTDLLPRMDKKLDKLIENQKKRKREKTSVIKPKERDDKMINKLKNKFQEEIPEFNTLKVLLQSLKYQLKDLDSANKDIDNLNSELKEVK